MSSRHVEAQVRRWSPEWRAFFECLRHTKLWWGDGELCALHWAFNRAMERRDAVRKKIDAAKQEPLAIAEG
jgi:hypothetical protein